MLKKITIFIIMLTAIILAFLEGLGLGAWSAITNQTAYNSVMRWWYMVRNPEQEP